jgi:hypothetical protein
MGEDTIDVIAANLPWNPMGNLFCAFAIKDQLVRMLDPKPPAYAG